MFSPCMLDLSIIGYRIKSCQKPIPSIYSFTSYRYSTFNRCKGLHSILFGLFQFH